MLYLQTTHPPSAVLSSATLHFTTTPSSGSPPQLILAYIDRIQVVSLGPSPARDELVKATAEQEEPLTTVLTIPLNARILGVRALPSANRAKKGTLLVLTDHPRPRLLALTYSPTSAGLDPSSDIRAEVALELSEPARRASDYLNSVWVDTKEGGGSGSRTVVAHTHSGVLKVIPVSDEDGDYIDVGRAFSVRLPEPTLLALTFVSPSGTSSTKPLIATLALSPTLVPTLLLRTIDFKAQDVVPYYPVPSTSPTKGNRASTRSAVEDTDVSMDDAKTGVALLAEDDAATAHALHAVPSPVGGVLVFTEYSIVYVHIPDSADVKTFPSSSPHKARRGSLAEATSVVSEKGKGKRRRGSKSSTTFAGVIGGRIRLPFGPLKVESVATVDTSASVSQQSLSATDDQPEAGKSERDMWFLVGTTDGLLYLLSLHIGLESALSTSPASVSSHQGNTSPRWMARSLSLMLLGPVPTPSNPSGGASNGGVTYLGDSYVFVGSSAGDSGVYRVLADPARRSAAEGGDVDMAGVAKTSPGKDKGKGKIKSEGTSQSTWREADTKAEETSYLEEVHRWKNLGPVMDFVVEEEGSASGQGRLITCSGARTTGSLRVVRKGVGLCELGELDIADVTKIWTVPRADGNTLLLLSHPANSLALLFSPTDGSFEELDSSRLEGAKLDRPTLSAAAIGAVGDFVQVTDVGVFFVGADGNLKGKWEAKDGVSVAASNAAGQVVVGRKEGRVAYLQVDEAHGVQLIKETVLSNDVSCLDLTPIQGAAAASIAAVGFWKSLTVSLLSLPELKEISTALADDVHSSLPRSILLHSFGTSATTAGRAYMLVGLGDGTLVSYSLSLSQGSATVSVKDKKTATLGTRSLDLAPFATATGVRSVFASSDRPTVVFAESGDKLSYSSVGLRDVRTIAPFITPDAPSALVFALPQGLRFGQIDEIQKLDIRTIELGVNNPTAICHHAPAKAYGVAVVTDVYEAKISMGERPGSFFELYDDATFEPLGRFTLKDTEVLSSVTTASFGSAPAFFSTYFILGTGFIDPRDPEPTRGRVIVLRLTRQREVRVVASTEVRGNVYSVRSIGSRVAAAVNSSVIIFDFEASADGAGKLKRVADWGCAFVAMSLAVREPRTLVVADAMRSIVVLSVDETTGKLEEVARDHEPYWMTSAEVVDDDTFIGAEIGFNLFTAQRAKRPKGGDGGLPSRAMTSMGGIHWGDMINKFKKGSLVAKQPDADPGAEPRLIFCTSSGAVAMVAALSERLSRICSDLERNMRSLLPSLANLDHQEWRTVRTEHRVQPPAGFVDGDFIQRFGDLSKEDRQKVMKGTNEHERMTVSEEELIAALESLARLS